MSPEMLIKLLLRRGNRHHVRSEQDRGGRVREGRAEVVTDHVESFNEAGIKLQSGDQLDADIIILATGLNLKFAGGVSYTIDDKPVDFSERYVYRGMMFSDVPNMAFVVGYTNSSWTLKADLTNNYVCRLLNHMASTGTRVVTPQKGSTEIEEAPLLDFDAGYVLRSLDQFPKQGKKFPWRNYQNYIKDFFSLRYSRLHDQVLKFQ